MLTRDEAIRKHRELWNWVADKIENEHRWVHEFENADVYASNLLCDCWLCEYAVQENGLKNKCDGCPVNWGESKKCCTQMWDGLYDIYLQCLIGNKWKYAAKIAREIANLPEKRE